MPLTLILLVATLPSSYGSGELVTNGGFETGDLAGWIASASSVIVSQYPEQAHSGRYSAGVGTLTAEGLLSQTVTIPAKSSAKFTAWYKIEQGSRLRIVLNSSDGSVIQQWSFASVSQWMDVTYDLGVSCPSVLTCPASKDVTIEFVGEGNNDYRPYVDDVSLTYTVVLYETDVVITGSPVALPTKLFVDGKQVDTLAGDVGVPGGCACGGWWQSTTLTFKIGETHTISVESYLYKDNRTRYYSASNTATVRSDRNIVFSYKPQYYLSAVSPYGTTTEAGGTTRETWQHSPSHLPNQRQVYLVGLEERRSSKHGASHERQSSKRGLVTRQRTLQQQAS